MSAKQEALTSLVSQFRRSLIKPRLIILTRNQKIANMGPTVTAPRTILQDMPPEGGFPPVRFRRNLPTKMWKGQTIVVLAMFVMAYGWYKYFFLYVRKQQLEQERFLFTDLAVNPFLQAEKDIMYVKKNCNLHYLGLLLNEGLIVKKLLSSRNWTMFWPVMTRSSLIGINFITFPSVSRIPSTNLNAM